MSEAGRHLDPLELDALRAGEPLPAAASAHAAWCPQCRAELAELRTLAAVLQRPAASGAVPAARDAAILAAAQLHAARVRRARRRTLPAAVAVAAVAVLALAGLLRDHRGAPPAVELAAAPRRPLDARAADLDGDGRVTVLDAFTLARAARLGTPRVGGAAVEQVDAVLAMAVSVEAR